MATTDQLDILQTRKPGEVYLPALAKCFQLVELRDHWLRFPHLEFENAGPAHARKLPDGTYLQRLQPGDEMAWVKILYFATDRTDNDNVTININTQHFDFPKPILRHAMEPLPLITSLMNTIDSLRGELDRNQRKLVVLDATLEKATVDESVKKLVKELRIGIPDVVPPISSAMKNQGFKLTPTQQIKDDDDIKVKNLKSGLLFLGGIAKVLIGR